MTDLYAVTGNPIEHSLSPRIHTLFAAQTGQDLRYEARLGDPEQFPAQLRAWFADGLAGLNVTLPFKETAFQCADTRSDRAEAAGAVNTLWCDANDRLTGDNTDGAGFMADLQRLGVTVAERKILLLGAGGATRGLLHPLLLAHPAKLVVANRTPQRAQALVERFRDLDPHKVLSACALEALPMPTVSGEPFDLIINATAAGLGAAGLQLPLNLAGPESFAYDLVYGPAARPFLGWAARAGVAGASDGLGMLVAQAAEAFWLWRGIRPETAPVLQALRA